MAKHPTKRIDIMKWFWYVLAACLAVTLGCFGHPILGVVIARLVWCVPNKRNSKTVDDVEDVEA